MPSNLNENYSYTSGDCDIYAISLHKLTNYPLYVIRGFYKDELGDGYEDCHMVVKSPNGKYLDVNGENTIKQLKNKCLFSNAIYKIKIVPISEEEAKYCFSMSGPSSEDIDKTIEYIKSKNLHTESEKYFRKIIRKQIINFFI